MEGFVPTYAEACNEYLLSLQAVGCSAYTVGGRRRLLRRLGAHCGERLAVSSSDLASFLAGLRVSRNTLAHYLNVFGLFFAFCVGQGWLGASPASSLPRLPCRSQPVDPVSMDEVRCALAVAGPRERAIIIILLTTGMRAGELAGLRQSDIDWDRGLMRIRGKGRSQRVAAIVETAREPLRQHIGRLSYYIISYDMRALGRRAHIRRFHAHRLRHSFAVELLKAGARLDLVSQLLGHHSITATMAYVRYESQQDALEIQRRLNPVDRLGDAV